LGCSVHNLKSLGPQERQQLFDRLVGELDRKLRLLAIHYDIDSSLESAHYYFFLANAVAANHVPGFKIRNYPRSGRKKIWSSERLEELRVRVGSRKQKLGIKATDKEALRRMADDPTDPFFKSGLNREEKARYVETLESRLQDAKVDQDYYQRALIEVLKRP
jgi:hypothetical protein